MLVEPGAAKRINPTGSSAGIPGMSISRAANGPTRCTLSMKSTAATIPVPDIWMDNTMYSIDGWSSTHSMNAKRMEVFTRQSRVPAQYRTTSNCGAILVWTY